jgi:1,4-alpha-glucan branching enzyme
MEVILNSDDKEYGGSGVVAEIKWYEETGWNNKPNSLIITFPRFRVLFETKAN